MKFGLNVVQRLFFGALGIFCVSESGKYDILFVEMSYREGGGGLVDLFVCLSPLLTETNHCYVKCCFRDQQIVKINAEKKAEQHGSYFKSFNHFVL